MFSLYIDVGIRYLQTVSKKIVEVYRRPSLKQLPRQRSSIQDVTIVYLFYPRTHDHIENNT